MLRFVLKANFGSITFRVGISKSRACTFLQLLMHLLVRLQFLGKRVVEGLDLLGATCAPSVFAATVSLR